MLHAVSALAADPAATDYVRGEFHELNDNGAWSWFMDERTIVDRGQLLVGNLFGQPTNHWVLTGYRDKTKNHPMNSAKIPIRQSLRSPGLHVLRSGEGADGKANNAHLHARCKALLGLLQTANREPRTANVHV